MSAEELLRRLEGKGQTLAVAESCTGGLLSSMLCSVPGASRAFLGSTVAYSDGSKVSLLQVEGKAIEEHGAVSEEVAVMMASGVRGLFGADVGVGVTGIAGPGGGSEEKPIGTVHMAASDGRHTVSERRRFPGGREEVRSAAAAKALELTLELLEME